MADLPVTIVSVRYMINDVQAAIAFYTKYLGFTVEFDLEPRFCCCEAREFAAAAKR